MARRKRRKSNKKRTIIFLITTLLIISMIVFACIKINSNREHTLQKQKLEQDIISHYNEYVMTNKVSDIYKLENSKYTKVGKIGANQELTLENKNITYEDEYLKVNTFEQEYYIYYKDLDVIEKPKERIDRYKKYIVFNKNIITKEITNFYDEEDNFVYTLPESFNLPIIINKKDTYGVEFNNRLLYIKKEDVVELKDNQNTESKNTTGIAVLNYHFFYDASIASERADCNQSICLSTDNLRKHLDYIKQNNIYTPNMKELEMYIDGYIQLPKSVVLTIDDGWRADIGSNIMAEYGLNATVFLMTAGYDPGPYQNDYVEVHSHGHDLHNPGVCKGGQGGAIKCLNKEKLLADLKTSQDKLNGTTVFCYPFYEYNNYSIEVLKEAGYKMAFGGYKEGGYYKVSPGINKYKLPRYVISINTSAEKIASYIN